MIRIANAFQTYWRNALAENPVFAIDLELNDLADWRIDELPDEFLQRFGDLFPPIEKDGDQDVGAPNLNSGPFSAPELIAVIALNLQRAYDPVPISWGVASGEAATGSMVYFSSFDSHFAKLAAGIAVHCVNLMAGSGGGEAPSWAEFLESVWSRCERAGLDIITRRMVAAAGRRNIPWRRLLPWQPQVALGQGCRRARLQNTRTENLTALAYWSERDKFKAFELLGSAGMPVGRYARVNRIEQAAQMAERVGYPIVVKPVFGLKGIGVAVGLKNEEQVRRAVQQLLASRQAALLQTYIKGDDYRFLVVGGRMIAATRRDPASVTGDGRLTVAELISEANKDPRRGSGHSRLMNTIVIDDEVRHQLAEQELDLNRIPAEGQKVLLRRTGNISTGGTAVDVTESVHPDNVKLAERAARILNIDVAGIDFICSDISRSWRETGGAICEINSGPGLRPHWISNPDRDVVGPILETIFPPGDEGRIPIALVTGTNGKTTTVRMLSRILERAGHVVGAAMTDGVVIDGERVLMGDVAGVPGAEVVLRDPRVTAAVLETARGGLIKFGIYCDRSDVAALLNVEADHIGLDGIANVDAMASAKRKVLETARRGVVLNADDPRCAAMANAYPRELTLLFSLAEESPAFADHIAAGGRGVIRRGSSLSAKLNLVDSVGEHTILNVAELKSGWDGTATHNIANAMAAAAMAVALDIPIPIIADALASFETTFEQSPGRLNLVPGFPCRMIFDFANNPAAFEAAVKTLEKIDVSGRRIAMITTAGNRLDEHYASCGRALAGHFDLYLCYDRIDWRRGREPGEVARLMAENLTAAGVAPDAIVMAEDEAQAANLLRDIVDENDLAVVFGTEALLSVSRFKKIFGIAPANPGSQP